MTVPVHCKCGWTGFRRAERVKAWPCPACDGEVARFRKLERAAAKVEEITRPIEETPLESYIAETNEPVPRLPNPYILRDYTGKVVGVFRVPNKSPRKRRRR